MYSTENKSTISAIETSRYPVAAALTLARQDLTELGQDVVLNDNSTGMPRKDQALSVARTVATIVKSSMEALCDAKDLLRQLGLSDWFDANLQQHIDDLNTDALPELWALIERLEVEAKR